MQEDYRQRATKGQSSDVAKCARQFPILAVSPIHALRLYRITYVQEIEVFLRSYSGKIKHHLLGSIPKDKEIQNKEICGEMIFWCIRAVRNTKAHLATSTEGAQ